MLQGEVDTFLADVRARLARKSWELHRQVLTRVLIPFCEVRGIERTSDIDDSVMVALALELRTRNLSDSTRNTYLRHIKVFLNQAAREDDRRAPKVPMRRLRPKHRDVLSVEECRRLVAAARTIRDRLILQLAVDTGARLGEIAGLRLGDFRTKGRSHFVRFSGKTGERLVPISPSLGVAIQAMIQHRPKLTADQHLFLSDRRREGFYRALGPKGIYLMVLEAAEKADIGHRVHPHLLRHSAITRMVAEGMNPITISELVGVGVDVISQHYTHQSDEDRYDAMMRHLAQMAAGTT